jgi:biopolymer transport protein ExbD
MMAVGLDNESLRAEDDDLDGPLVLAPKAKLEDAEMDITPMIDITFLLLIFFLVAAKMDSQKAVGLPDARSGGAVLADKAVTIIIVPSGADAVLVSNGDGGQFSSDLEQQEEEIATYVEEQLDSGKQFVLLKAGKGIRHKEVSRVAQAIGKADVPSLYLAVKQLE